MSNVTLIQKPVNWFALEIKWLVCERGIGSWIIKWINGVIIVPLSLTLPKLIHLILFLICFCRFVRKRNLRLFAIKMSFILSNFFDTTFLQMKRILFKVTKLTLYFTWKITMIWTEYETDPKIIKQLTTSAIRATISE